MDLSVFIAILAAALLHAGWNSVVKVGLDRYSAVLLLACVQALIALPLLPFVPAPAMASWGWIGISALLHTGYKIFLVKAYDYADLSQAYPIARGVAPFLVFLFSLVFLGVAFTWSETLSVLAICGGILVLALKGSDTGRISGRALLFSVATAGFTAGYTLVDGLGARVAGTASGYILWMVVGDAAGMIVHAIWRRGLFVNSSLRTSWRLGLSAGAMSLGSYWIAVWAFTMAPIALVAALRETSILFATIIAATVIGERVNCWRWLAAVCIVCGVILVRF